MPKYSSIQELYKCGVFSSYCSKRKNVNYHHSPITHIKYQDAVETIYAEYYTSNYTFFKVAINKVEKIQI